MKSTHLIPRKTPVWLGAILIVLAGCIPEPDARLSALSLSYGALDPSFTANATEYSIEVPFLVTNLRVTPVSSAPGASIMVDGTPVASGAESQTLELAEGDTTIDIEVTAVDGVTTKTYAVTVTRHGVAQFAQQAYIKASNTDGGDWFGYSLALSGDTLAVGAPYEASGATGIDGNESDASAPDSGAVYVFVRSGGTWTQQAYVKASNPDPGDVFGMAVALHGDVLVVGAPGEASGVAGVNSGGEDDNSLVDAGAAYVFVREGTAWTQQAYLKASNPGEEDTFGSTVAVMGDTIAVGVDGEDSASAGVNGNGADDSAQNAGAVYVFARDGAAWTQQAYIKASNAQALDAFGATVALSGEWMAVGAPRESSGATGIGGNQADDSADSAGAVYVFKRDGGAWAQRAYIKASNTAAYDHFGYRVALSGDTLAVTAVSESSSAVGVGGDQSDDSAPSSGAVYVFVRSGSDWAQQAYIKASNTQAVDVFGEGLSLSGDTMVVSAPWEDSAGAGVNNGNEDDNSLMTSGAAYVFVRVGTSWEQRAFIKASNAGMLDSFGTNAVVDGDTIVVSAYEEDSGASGIDGDQADDTAENAGAVYVFR